LSVEELLSIIDHETGEILLQGLHPEANALIHERIRQLTRPTEAPQQTSRKRMNGRGLESYGGALRNTDKILFGTVKISVPEKMYAIGHKGRLTAKSVLTKNGTLTKSAIILESDKNSNKVEIIDQGQKHNDKILFGTIRIRLPQKMTVKGPNGKITTKNTLTNSNTISFANKDPSVKFIPGTNTNVQILDFGTNLKSQEPQNKTPKTTKPKSTKSNKEKNDNKKFNAEPEFNKEEIKKKI
jgi:hypothetical protein